MFYKKAQILGKQSKPWTKNLVVKKTVEESNGILCLDKSGVKFYNNKLLSIDFIKDHYSEAGFLTINGSINYSEAYFFDLFSYSRDLLKKSKIDGSTTIGEFQAWEDSPLSKTFNEIYLPLLRFLNNESSWKLLVAGHKDNIDFKSMKDFLPEYKFDELHQRLKQLKD